MGKISILMLFLSLGGCAYLNGKASNHLQPVQSYTSNEIYPSKIGKNIYLQVNNLTMDAKLPLKHQLVSALEGNFNIVDDLKDADNILQISVLYFGKSNKFAIQHALGQGFGDNISRELDLYIPESEPKRASTSSMLALKLFNLSRSLKVAEDYVLIADVNLLENGKDNSFRVVTVATDSKVDLNLLKPNMFNNLVKKLNRVVNLEYRLKENCNPPTL